MTCFEVSGPKSTAKPGHVREKEDRRGGEDFRGDPEGQQRDREVIDDRMQMIRADQLRKHLTRPLLDDRDFHLHVAVAGAAVMVADDGEVAGGVRRDGDILRLVGGMSVSILSGFDMKPCTRSELLSRRMTGSPFLSVIWLGVNSNFFALISITFGLSLARVRSIIAGDTDQPDFAYAGEQNRGRRFC